jgi:hypothetical protein
MPRSPRSIPPPWNEHDSYRETTLQNFTKPDRKALRRVGRLLHSLSLETREPSGESLLGDELRAVAADLRYLSGYCAMLGKYAEWHDLDAAEEALAHFAAGLAPRVGALIEAIEEELAGDGQPAPGPSPRCANALGISRHHRTRKARRRSRRRQRRR